MLASLVIKAIDRPQAVAHIGAHHHLRRERERRNICANILPIAFRLRSNISRATLMIILCGDLVLRMYRSRSI